MMRNRISNRLASAMLCSGLLFGLAAPPANAQTLEWVRQLGTVEYDESIGASADALGNVYIAGSTYGSLGGPNAGGKDAFITKYDATGTLQWTRQFGTGFGDATSGISADDLGNIYIGGTTDGSLGGPNAGQSDAFLSKYDPAGNRQWTRQFGNTEIEHGGSVSADGLGNVYMVKTTDYGHGQYGGLINKYDAAGNLQWTKGGHGTLSADSLGNLFMAGTDSHFSGQFYGYISKYDADGNVQWSKSLIDTAYPNNFAGGVSADGLGHVYLTGRIENDYFLRKYDAGGNLQWTKDLNSGGSVSADGLGSAYITGVLAGNAFVSKYDAAGTRQWSQQFGTASPPFAPRVSADALGHLYLSGSTDVSLGGPSAGSLDAFLAKVNDPVTPTPLLGDYNANGTVDTADYVIWRRTLGHTGTGLAADGNGNDVIDAGDYDVWRANFGQSTAAEGIPEPASWLLAVLAGVTFLKFAGRRKTRLARSFPLLLCVIAGLALAGRADAGTLYAATAGAHGELYILDPNTGGVLRDVGPLNDAAGRNYPVTGLAFHPRTGVLYGSTFNSPMADPATVSRLVVINPTTAEVTVVGQFNLGNPGTPATMTDLAINRHGILYGIGSHGSPRIYIIDIETGIANAWIGPFGTPTNVDGGGLATFYSDFFLTPTANQFSDWWLVTSGSHQGWYYLTKSNPDKPAGGGNYGALDFDGNVLYGLNVGPGSPPQTHLVTIRTGTGAVTDIGRSVDSLDAIAFRPDVLIPEPASWLLAALAGAGLLCMGKCRRNTGETIIRASRLPMMIWATAVVLLCGTSALHASTISTFPVFAARTVENTIFEPYPFGQTFVPTPGTLFLTSFTFYFRPETPTLPLTFSLYQSNGVEFNSPLFTGTPTSTLYQEPPKPGFHVIDFQEVRMLTGMLPVVPDLSYFATIAAPSADGYYIPILCATTDCTSSLYPDGTLNLFKHSGLVFPQLGDAAFTAVFVGGEDRIYGTIPEPATEAILGLAILTLGRCVRRRSPCDVAQSAPTSRKRANSIVYWPASALLCCGLSFGLIGRPAQAQSLEWVRQLGSAKSETTTDVSADGLGNVYIAGFTDGNLGGPHQGGGLDVFLSKYNEDGNLEWVRQFGGETIDFSHDVSADGLGNVYVSGHYSGSAFLTKFDSSGVLQWNRQFGGWEESYGVSADGLGKVYISGHKDGNASVAKYDDAGVLEWTKQLDLGGRDFSNGVSADALGNVYIAGYSDTGLGPPGGGPSDVFVSKFDAAGNLDWTGTFDLSVRDTSTGVSTDGLGNMYIAGTGDTGPAPPHAAIAFISKYNVAGNLEWTKQFEGEARDVSADPLGNVYMSGWAGESYLSKFDAAGNHLWKQHLGEQALISTDGLRNVYVAGSTGGSLGGPSAGGQDAFVAKFNDFIIPEPASWLLAALAGAAVLCIGSRRRKVADSSQRGRTDALLHYSSSPLFHLMCGGLLVGLLTPPAHAQTLEWVRQSGTTEPENSYDVSADSLGNVYISGGFGDQYYGEYPIYPGYGDAFLTKYDAAGNFQWTQYFSTDQADVAQGVSADGLGNVYISGGTGGYGGPDEFHDAFVAKYDAAGSLQWTRQLGTGRFYWSAHVSADPLGNVFISGVTRPSAEPFVHYDTFVTKYDAAGNLQWARQLGTPVYEQSTGASADGLGNVYASGITGGNLGGPNAGGSDSFVSKYDAAGNLLWTRQFGTSKDDSVLSVATDSLGNVFFSGYTLGDLGGPSAGDWDAFVGAYDSAGNLQWIKQFGTSGIDLFGGVAADGLGNVYVSGSLASGPYSRQAFFSKYDAEGAVEWTKFLDQGLEDVAADGLGNMYLRGDILVSPGGGGPDPRVDPPDYDVLIAKYSDCGGCEPPPVPPIVVDLTMGGEIRPGSLITHQFTTSFGDTPVSWSNLTSLKSTVNPPTLTESGLFSWQTTKLDGGGLYNFDVTATNVGGSDVGRLTLRLAIIPEPSTALLWLGLCSSLIVRRSRG